MALDLAACDDIIEAIEGLEKLMAAHPGFARGHNDLGVLHYNHGNKAKALQQAKQYRDSFIASNPPLSRQEFCSILRSNNSTGITGVYRYAKSYRLKNGELKKSWYWEATWPIGKSRQSHIAFSVNDLGERKARQLAIRARKNALAELEGVFWASARGA